MGSVSENKKNKLSKIKASGEKSLAGVLHSELLGLCDNIGKSYTESGTYKVYKFLSRKTGHIFNSFKRTFSGTIEKSRILSFIDRLPVFILEKSLRYYGVGLFFYGFFYLALSLFKEISQFGDIAILTEGNFLSILPGVFTVIVASVMMISQSNFASLVLKSKLFCFLLFDLFSFDRKHIEKITPCDFSHTLPVIIGMVGGISSLIVSPTLLLKVIFIFICVYVVMKRPENGIIGVCLVFPFVSADKLIKILVLVAISYFVKVLRLKRVFKFGVMDAVIAVVASVIFVCGMNSAGIHGSSAEMYNFLLCLLFGFILSNTIRTSQLAAKCVNSLLVSVSFAAIFSIISFVVNRYNLQNLNSFTHVIFNYPSAFPLEKGENIFELLIMFIPFALAKRSQKGISAGTHGIIAFVLLCGAAFISMDISIWICAVVAVVFYICFMKRSLAFPSFVTFATLLTFTGIFPNTIEWILSFIKKFFGAGFDFQKVAYANSIGIDVLDKTFFGGLGLAEISIDSVVYSYYGSGFESMTHNMTFILKAVLEIGVLGVLTVLLAYITFFVYGYGILYSDKIVSAYKPYIAAAISALSAFLIRGLVFPASVSLQSILVISIFVYLCTAVKQSALAEYVPKGVDLIRESY